MAELDYKMISGFRESLIRFPSNHSKRKAYRGKPITEILQMTSHKVSNPLSVSSVNKHIIRTGAFLKWAVRRGYVTANFAEGLTITKKGKASEEREGLDLCARYTRRKVTCYSDSELVIKQMNGVFRLKNDELRKLFRQVLDLARMFDEVVYQHVPRGNQRITRADQLVNQAHAGRPIDKCHISP